jgi:hypothetical protein
MKKKLRIVGVILVILIGALFIVPIVFEDDIEKIVLEKVNKELKADISWEDFKLSLLADFPHAQLSISELSLVNKESPFKGDTLAKINTLKAGMPITQIFSDHISIEYFTVNKADIKLKTNEDGQVNYLITKASPENADENTSDASAETVKFTLSNYEITNSELHYIDLSAKTDFGIKNLNHEGSGNFTTDQFMLKTTSDAMVSFAQDGTYYLAGNHIQITSDFDVDLNQMRFEFLNNRMLINQLPLKFDGSYQLGDEGDAMNIDFSTPNSDFKNLLALIPEAYQKQMSEVKTTGEFSLKGKVNGSLTDEKIPHFNISVTSQDASFNFPSLPKKAEHIELDVQILNATGNIDDTQVLGKKIDFSISGNRLQNTFSMNDLMDKIIISYKGRGKMNLADIQRVYPMEEDFDLKGDLAANIQASFTMDAIEKEQYSRVKTNGNLSLNNFNFTSDQLPHPVNIKESEVIFNQDLANLNEFSMTTGETDIQATGSLSNFLGFALKNQELKGSFQVSSNQLLLSDLMTADDSGQVKNEDKDKTLNTSDESLKIPDFLNLNANFKADKLVYDNLSLTNASGKLSVKNQIAKISDFKANTLSGAVKGAVLLDTQSDATRFDSKLNLDAISITQSINQLITLQKLAPVLQVLNGVLSTDINLNGTLDNNLSPNFDQLQGLLTTDVQQAGVEPKKMKLVNSLDQQLGFLKGKDLNLKTLKAKLKVKNGDVNVSPFSFKVDDIIVEMSGRHSFTQNMNYQLNLDVPAKYLGDKIGNQLADLSNADRSNMKVDVPVDISGALKKPKIQVNMQQAVKNLTQQIVDAQKDKLKDKAKNTVKDKINNLLGGDKESTDKDKSNDKDEVKDKAEDLLNNLLGGKKKKK